MLVLCNRTLSLTTESCFCAEPEFQLLHNLQKKLEGYQTQPTLGVRLSVFLVLQIQVKLQLKGIASQAIETDLGLVKVHHDHSNDILFQSYQQFSTPNC